LDTPHSSVRAFAVVACGYWTAPGYRSVAWLLTAGMVVLGAANVGIALWLKVDDAQALHDQLAGRGVTILTDPFDGPFGRTFALRDPDGYAVTIHDAA